jgi:aspartate kinase
MTTTSTSAPSPVLPQPSAKKAILVQKFGGSSVADVEKIKHVASLVAQAHDEGFSVLATVSAMGKTTDGLVGLAQAIMPHPEGREFDMLLATGEMVSAALLAMTLQHMGYKAIALNGHQAGIRVEDEYNKARIQAIHTQEVQRLLADGNIVIVTGFQGTNSKQEFVTLGRGGSDTTAVALAGALNATRCDIYTDVPGVFSTDPRIVPHAVRLNEIAFIEMMELARLGAKVLHPRSVETARRLNVPLRVCSTFQPENKGTLVVNENALQHPLPVTGVACDKNQARLAVVNVPDQPGIAAQVFNQLAQAGVSVDMIIQSLGADGQTNDIAFTVASGDLPKAITLMEALLPQLGGESIQVDEAIAKVSVVGVGMIDRPGIAADMFNALSDAGINIKMISTSEIKISCLVDRAEADAAVRCIHDRFFQLGADNQVRFIDEKTGY